MEDTTQTLDPETIPVPESEEDLPAKQPVPEIDPALAVLFAPKKKNRKKRILFAAIPAAVCLCATGIFFLVKNAQKNTAEEEAVYREYTVARGNVTVGNSESSSVSLNRETVTFNVSASVEEVYVKAGSFVGEGDPLLRMNLEDIQAGITEYELELQELALELDEAKMEQQEQLLKASQTYDTAVLTGEQDDDTETLTIGKAENTLETAQQKVDDLEDELDDLETLYEDYDDREEELEDLLEDKAESYSALESGELAALEDTNTYYCSSYTVLRQNKSNYISAMEAAGLSAEEAQASYTRLYRYLKAIYDYADAGADWTEDYSKYDSKSELKTAVNDLKSELESAELSLSEAELGYNSNALKAQQQNDTAALGADTAATQYELTVSKLQQAVDQAQEDYDSLNSELQDLKDTLSEDGIIYAPCTGMVASVSVEAGDEIEVYYVEDTGLIRTETVCTLTDISSVYVPITISEENILSVYIGEPAEVTMTAFPDQTFEAEVDTISVESSRSGAATVSYTVNVRYEGENELAMYEGMSADITLILKQVDDVLYVNLSAVTNTDGVATVLLKGEDGNPVVTEVTTGFSDGTYVEITSGLEEGDVVLAQSGVSK